MQKLCGSSLQSKVPQYKIHQNYKHYALHGVLQVLTAEQFAWVKIYIACLIQGDMDLAQSKAHTPLCALRLTGLY
jgi:hypothetical protein